MKRNSLLTVLAIAALLLAAALAAGCGGGDSPSSVVDDYIGALNERDFDKIYDLTSSSYQESQPKDEFVSGLEAVWIEGSSLEEYEIIEEKVDGDKATVTFKATVLLPGAPEDSSEMSESSVELVKEDGGWKLSF